MGRRSAKRARSVRYRRRRGQCCEILGLGGVFFPLLGLVALMLFLVNRSNFAVSLLEQGRSTTNPVTVAELPLDDTVIPGRVWETYGSRCIEDLGSVGKNLWQHRSPSVLIVGAMKAGTDALVKYLWDHPDVVPARSSTEMHFLNKRSRFFMGAEGIHQKRGRALYRAAFRESMAVGDFRSLQRNESVIALDKTPAYLYLTTLAPVAMCLVPWVKVVVVLRDPVDRAVSHFNMVHEQRRKAGKPAVDWEAWIRHDMALLRRAGVVRDWPSESGFRDFSGSWEEAEAWERYVLSHEMQALVGKGVYAIQLRRWMAAMEKAGKSRKDLFVVRSDLLRTGTQKEYSRLLDFLGLPEHRLRDASLQHTTSRSATPPLPGHLRAELEDFYRPYNLQLEDLLGSKFAWYS